MSMILFLIIIILISLIKLTDPSVLISSGLIVLGGTILWKYKERQQSNENENVIDTNGGKNEDIVIDNDSNELNKRRLSKLNKIHSERSTNNNLNDNFVTWTPDPNSISEKNLYIIDQVYGNKMNTTTNLTTKHNMRIGDRDRKATIAQIKGRRTNTYEPYYRQELSEHSSKRWWEPDDVLVRMLPEHQMNTIPMGRFTEKNMEQNLADYNTMGVNW